MTTIEKLNAPWEPPQLPSEIPHGDMPGDHISIYPDHVRKAETLFRALRPMLASQLSQSAHGRVVVSVCGGSGAGKTGIASVLAYFLRAMGIGTYLLSGDNYPRRIPQDNDQERIRVFRVAGLRGLLAEDQYTPERMAELFAARQAHRLEPKRLCLVQHRPDALPSLLLLEARMGGKAGLQVDAPWILQREDGSPTALHNRIYFREE